MRDVCIGMLLAGRYELREKLGAGGMGTVFRGYDKSLQREVAVKIFKSSILTGAKQANRMKTEGQALASLRHANIVTILSSSFEDEDAAFLVMELVNGETVEEIVDREGPMTPVRVTRLGAQLADALAEAHRSGVIHRDLKPQNLMVSTDSSGEEQIKIMDFGIARLIGVNEQRLTQTGEIIGTPQYISPEQCTTDGATERSDIYSLGCTLYFMLTGNPPFTAASPMAVLMKHVNQMPDTGAIHDERLRNIIGKCMEKKADDRFQTAEEIKVALRTSSTISRATAKQKHARSKPSVLPLVALLVPLLIGIAILWNQKQEPVPVAKDSVREFHETYETKINNVSPQQADKIYRRLVEIAPLVLKRDPDLEGNVEESCHAYASRAGRAREALNHYIRIVTIWEKKGTYYRIGMREFIERMANQNRFEEAIPRVKREIERQDESGKSFPEFNFEARILRYALAHGYRLSHREKEFSELMKALASEPQKDAEMFERIWRERDSENSDAYDTFSRIPLIYIDLYCNAQDRYGCNLATRSYAYLCYAYFNKRTGDWNNTYLQAASAKAYAISALEKQKLSPLQRTMCDTARAESGKLLTAAMPHISEKTQKMVIPK